jgi:hypothetical protein
MTSLNRICVQNMDQNMALEDSKFCNLVYFSEVPIEVSSIWDVFQKFPGYGVCMCCKKKDVNLNTKICTKGGSTSGLLYHAKACHNYVKKSTRIASKRKQTANGEFLSQKN